MHLVIGGAVLAIIALLSLSTPRTEGGRKQIEQTLLGALTVGAIVLVLTKAGLPWLAIALVLLFTSAKRFARRESGPPDAESTASSPSGARSGPSEPMTHDEAYRVLGLSPGADREQIIAEYRRLMKRVHPDQGGTTYLATQLNQAKETLLGK